MKRKEIEKLMNKHLILECEIENVFYFVEDILNLFAKETEENEPYATNTIKELRNAAMCVGNYGDFVNEIMDNDKED